MPKIAVKRATLDVKGNESGTTPEIKRPGTGQVPILIAVQELDIGTALQEPFFALCLGRIRFDSLVVLTFVLTKEKCL